MEKVLNITETILNSPYVNMFLAVLFLYTSITGLIDNYQSNIKGLSIHHGIALYGLVMFLKSIITALQAISGIKKVKDQLSQQTVNRKN
ncbi:MAG: hypothetical protein VR77_01430 [Flavobacteriales bacterium BRH_c54]|nr:MAG: hypothetical protein VR77_01430 [Flavobacteriales bacterium BRH_c54]